MTVNLHPTLNTFFSTAHVMAEVKIPQRKDFTAFKRILAGPISMAQALADMTNHKKIRFGFMPAAEASVTSLVG